MEQKQSEPTMEEILASIRRIISEDAPAAAVDGEPAAEPPKDILEPPEDILELTEVVAEEAPAAPAPRAMSAQEEIDALMNAPEPPPAARAAIAEPSEEWTEPPDEWAEPPAAAPRRDDSDDFDGEILSNSTVVASTAALAGLSGAVRSRLNGGMHVGSDLTLEELMRELLRPMLKEWLDANLPTVVERLVQREVERIARRAGER